MPQYMLDTDTVSFALRGQGRVAAARTPPLGALHQLDQPRGTALRRRGTTIPEASPTVAASLARRGEPIGTFDTLMAAHALSLGLTIVTNNTQHFGRVVGLETENWV